MGGRAAGGRGHGALQRDRLECRLQRVQGIFPGIAGLASGRIDAFLNGGEHKSAFHGPNDGCKGDCFGGYGQKVASGDAADASDEAGRVQQTQNFLGELFGNPRHRRQFGSGHGSVDVSGVCEAEQQMQSVTGCCGNAHIRGSIWGFGRVIDAYIIQSDLIMFKGH